jgi:hypothetical protein
VSDAFKSADPAVDRFWAKVEKSEGCWEWTAARYHRGHGATKFAGKHDRAHRVAWMLLRGPIPPGMCVLHKCDNPPCCNPDHLYIGTKTDNHRDMHARGRARPPRGERCGFAKLTEAQVRTIREIWASMPTTLGHLARLYGVADTAVSRIIRRKRWRHVA